MDIADHYAMRTGSAPLESGLLGKLTVTDLGMVRIPSGQLGACDPFVNLDDPVVFRIPPGDYPVYVTVADVSEQQDGSHMREAYLSLVMSDATATRVEAAPGLDGPPPEGEFFGASVDAGTVAFVDADSVNMSMPEDPRKWYDDVFDPHDDPRSWFAIMDADEPLPAGTANLVMPRSNAGENVVLAHSGWGDGFYPVLQTKDAEGEVTAIHIDFGVVGKFEDEPNAGTAMTPAPPANSNQPSSN
ncbi:MULTISPECIES: DUF4241 domain-containing protein [Arthrobacter]|uniref:DUF4241 domain-containing protein n=1 Tax=Arthrobacter terricola TaxID=2547396 RepID=A0A4R5KCD4_9MICC|nr:MULTISPECIES: DUF4241 domain-containing protein [Arthrobacter]MBT8162601.1 DUF4241 domain-containing protein [Arthrobacter sp. GN70]TDF92843.1 DUF4241 domain-containing protein [Arthrobacter terricola]